MASHLSHALVALLDRRGTTATALAAEIGVHQTTVSRACTGERLSVDSLRALCHGQRNAQDGLDLLLAHLRDEVERAGRLQTEITIEVDHHQVDSDVRLLEEQSRHDEDLKAILSDLARMVRSIRRKYPSEQYTELSLVAEDESKDSPESAAAAASLAAGKRAVRSVAKLKSPHQSKPTAPRRDDAPKP